MRIARAILSVATVAITLAGLSAFGAETPAPSCSESALVVEVPGVEPEACVATGLGPVDALATTLDDFCAASCEYPAVEAAMQETCSQAGEGKPSPSPSPEKNRRCVDIFDGECFAGCCGKRKDVQQWAQCCAANGGACNCEAVCNPLYCN